MSVFAISDLHLPGGEPKPMHIFGAHWEDHFERIKADWTRRVKPEDVVLIPGDISWAMRLPDALPDLASIGALPGQKALLRGNHDYWWSSIGRVRAVLPAGMYAVQNDAVRFGDIIVCGSRGWLCPGFAQATEEDARIYQRELLRLEMSLAEARKKCVGVDSPWMIAMLHFPPFAPFSPFSERPQETEVMRLLSAYGVHDAVYGHLHGAGLAGAFSGEMEGVRYHQVSCDGLGFALYEVRRA